uniref:Rca1 n=1 Tax=Arundo donax TaxID=35708 RepID=A0A0A9RKE2_ARUDO
MMGTRGFSSLLYMPGSCTLVGLSAMFMRVAFTIWLLTVYWVVPPMRPAPASRSLMKRQHILPFLMMSAASRYRCLMSLAGSPALPLSSSPALIMMGVMPILAKTSSHWKDFP